MPTFDSKNEFVTLFTICKGLCTLDIVCQVFFNIDISLLVSQQITAFMPFGILWKVGTDL